MLRSRSVYLLTVLSLTAASLRADEPGRPPEPEAPAVSAAEAFDAPEFLTQYCLDCHQGIVAEAELDLAEFTSLEKIVAEPETWNKILTRVRNGEMPPLEAESTPTTELRVAAADWIETTLRQAACDDGISPGPAPLRRLNRSEYGATIRELLDIHVDAGQGLPVDGAGGEGFDNAAETLFISPIHAEKYLEAARSALGYAFSDPRARRRFLTAEPDEDTTPEEAARDVLDEFLPRAFRRPVDEGELDPYLALFRNAYERDQSYDVAMQFALEAVLISPHFLFRIEAPNPDSQQRLVGDFELASRLSYFLWGTMPDDELFRVAEQGKLQDEEVLQQQVIRMLGGESESDEDRGRRRRRRGNDNEEKVRQFAQSFIEQWLGTRELGRGFKPDESVGRYDSELEGGMKYEPVLFFQEIVTENLSLLNLLDSDFTYANRRLARHYRIRGEFREQPSRAELPEDSNRGGLLGMAGVLAVSSYPHRTSPVLRGKWVLETILGTPPPPPPPDVPELEEDHEGLDPQSLRERLEQHRSNPTCASCHSRIDPLGFGLENYDVLGRWRTEVDDQPIDSRGELPDGTTFEGPEGLKQVLLARKDQVVRNLTAKVLGYALGRGLTNEDYCTVDNIVDELKQNDYASHTLILGIVKSVPFRYKPGTDPDSAVAHTHPTRQEVSP
ncbi:MAG: DUF1588 domain-containing protein [Pirellulales bacterium]